MSVRHQEKIKGRAALFGGVQEKNCSRKLNIFLDYNVLFFKFL